MWLLPEKTSESGAEIELGLAGPGLVTVRNHECLWDASSPSARPAGAPNQETGLLVTCYLSMEDNSTVPSGHPVRGGDVKPGLGSTEWSSGPAHMPRCVSSTFLFFSLRINLICMRL